MLKITKKIAKSVVYKPILNEVKYMIRLLLSDYSYSIFYSMVEFKSILFYVWKQQSNDDFLTRTFIY